MMHDSNPRPVTPCSRRGFLQWTGLAAVAGVSGTVAGGARATAAPEPAAHPGGRCPPLTLGIATYTFRKFDLDKALAMTNRVGLTHVCLKSFHLPLEAKPDEIAAAAEKVRAAGLVLYGGGVISMQKEAQVTQAFDYAKAAGMKLIVAAPGAEMLPLIDRKIQQYDIAVAIHNHGPGDKHFPTPESAYEKIKNCDKRFGLCIDIGHTVRIGADLLESTEKYADRLLDVHMKDVTEAAPKGREIQAGRGIIDIPKFLRTLVHVKFVGVVSFEYEPEADDPLPGLAESVGYTRGAMAGLSLQR
jgi:sugar phosphate isomerase/epimerase